MKTSDAVNHAPVTLVPIARLVIGSRRRSKLGSVKRLAASIRRNGLIHPIFVRNGNELVSGGRRVEAFKLLGLAKIPARSADGLSDEALRAIELDENVERMDLLPADLIPQRAAELRAMAAQARAEEGLISARSPGRNKPRRHIATGGKKTGRPKGRKPGSERAVAESTGVSNKMVHDLDEAAALIARYPFLGRGANGWVKATVLRAGKALEQFEESKRIVLVAMLDQGAIPAPKAVKMIDNLAELSPAAQKEILDMARSDDAVERQRALTRALRIAPPVDPGLTHWREAVTQAREAHRACRWKEFDEQFAAIIDRMATLLKALQNRQTEERERDESRS